VNLHALPLDVGMRRVADISDDGRYRYALGRRWEEGGRAVTFVMLNPSTADAEQDDPTIRRCIGLARGWGYNALTVLNLFAYRATDPAELAKVGVLAVGPRNDDYLRRHVEVGRPMVAAWGAHRMARQRAAAVTSRLGIRWWCLGTTKDGSPRHPLYVRADTALRKWVALE
jgi:hypothetical protein